MTAKYVKKNLYNIFSTFSRISKLLKYNTIETTNLQEKYPKQKNIVHTFNRKDKTICER